MAQMSVLLHTNNWVLYYLLQIGSQIWLDGEKIKERTDHKDGGSDFLAEGGLILLGSQPESLSAFDVPTRGVSDLKDDKIFTG